MTSAPCTCSHDIEDHGCWAPHCCTVCECNEYLAALADNADDFDKDSGCVGGIGTGSGGAARPTNTEEK